MSIEYILTELFFSSVAVFIGIMIGSKAERDEAARWKAQVKALEVERSELQDLLVQSDKKRQIVQRRETEYER
jgi:hypothetical protein